MTKRSKKRTRIKKPTRKQLSRMEREERLKKRLTWGLTILTIAVVGILAYGFVTEKIVKARAPVAIVDGDPITTAEFQSRVRFLRMQLKIEQQRWVMEQRSLDTTDPNAEAYLEYIQGQIDDLKGQLAPMNALTIGEQSMDQLVLEKLVRQEAERRGITITTEEVQENVEMYFGYDRNPDTPTPTAVLPLTSTNSTPTPAPPTPTPMTEKDFRQRYNKALNSWKELGISEQQFRSWIEESLLLEKLQEQMSTEVSTTADQVELRYLNVDSEELAYVLAAKWDAGADFQTLSDELKEKEETSGYGQEIGWVTKELLEQRLGADLANLVFDMKVGEHSQPIPGKDGSRYYVAEVLNHEKERELDSYMLRQVQSQAFQEWVENQKQVSYIEYPSVQVECQGDTPWYKEACRRSWRDRDPKVCRWALLWPCGGSWRERVPTNP